MNSYPEAVAKIARDYLDRLNANLRSVPFRERSEFLAEIESHIYEAYQQRAGDDEIARILGVLRDLGEPAEVVADRLPAAMARSGAKRKTPLYILSGLLIALAGVPLGFGGVGVLIGLLAAVAGCLAAFYAAAGGLILAGGLITLTGLVRMYFPQFFDNLVGAGVIQFDAATADFLEHFTHSQQGVVLVICGSVILAAGLGMFHLGKYIFRGLRFLSSLLFDRLRPLARSLRAKLSAQREGATRPEPAPSTSWAQTQ